QAAEAGMCSQADELAPYLIIDDLRDADPGSTRRNPPEPGETVVDGRPTRSPAGQAEWPGIEQDEPGHCQVALWSLSASRLSPLFSKNFQNSSSTSGLVLRQLANHLSGSSGRRSAGGLDLLRDRQTDPEVVGNRRDVGDRCDLIGQRRVRFHTQLGPPLRPE